ncbi:unnamed protein product [Moneuplotes crassus]|uniref:Uncharacterized protein n=1 Tax=Euplotes crassus TaxID=5936 RepID=A0AAD1XXQ6_EUPCR|nr:unnamed protein product [Moneuplotes crassus]
MKIIASVFLLICLCSANVIQFERQDGSMTALISQYDTNIAFGLKGEKMGSLNKTAYVACVNTDADYKLHDGSPGFILVGGGCPCWSPLCQGIPDCPNSLAYGTSSFLNQGIYKSHSNKIFSLEDLSDSRVDSVLPPDETLMQGIFAMTPEEYEDAEFPDEANEDYAVCFSKVEDSHLVTDKFEYLDLDNGFEKTHIVVKTRNS